MLDKLKTLAQKLLGSQASLNQEILLDVFLPLGLSDQQLPEAVIHYILTGEGAHVLQTLNAKQDDTYAALLDGPGTTYYWHSSTQLSGMQKLDLKKSKSARNRLYTLWTETFSHEELVRYGKVLAAACRGVNLSITTPKVPLWFLYIFHDALYTTIESVKSKHFATVRKHWSVADLNALLNCDDDNQTDDDILFAIFDRQNLPDYYYDRLQMAYELPDLLDYIQEANLATFKSLPSNGLSVSGQSEQLAYLNRHPQLLKHLPDFVVMQSASSLKTIYPKAEAMLLTFDAQDYAPYLREILLNGNSKQRAQAADLVARHSQDKALLEEALPLEKSKPVQQKIQAALARFLSKDDAQSLASLDIPPFIPKVYQSLPDEALAILKQNHADMLAEAKIEADNEIADNEQEENKRYRSHWRQAAYKRLAEVQEHEFTDVLAYLNGETNTINKKSKVTDHIILYKKRISALAEFGLIHYLRAQSYAANGNYLNWYQVHEDEYNDLFTDVDLRQVIHDLTSTKVIKNPEREIAERFLQNYYYGNEFSESNNDYIWPFFAENMHYIDEALGLIPSQSSNRYQSLEPTLAMVVLQKFPTLPADYVPKILELALGEGKTLRPLAQALLENIPNIHERAEEALQSGKQEIRIVAAEWLVRLAQKTSIKPLYAALKKEKREVARAALLTALEKLGEDISDYLSPKALLAEAQKGLKAKRPSSFAWFDAQTIPALTWQNGDIVAPEIIEWWFVLAVKLKEPAGNALLQRYVSLLSLPSQQNLASFALLSFIAQDTRHPSEAEALAEAQSQAPSQLQSYQDWAKRYPEYYGKYATYTLEQVIEELKQGVLSRYLGSAIADKGMLALSCAIEGHVAVSHLQHYMKANYTRRAQIESLLAAIGNSNDPMIIQLLLSISRRYRTNSVQEKARALIEDIALRNGWSQDELADRTIPTAGLNEQGILSLDYGERVFTARLDAAYKLVLTNPEGKVIKALPEARKTEDAALVKDTKKQFTSSKKEIKQIVDLQTTRLFEAMCAKRAWPVAEWQEYLQQHPIMAALINRLVWLNIDNEGQTLQSFRPSDDGCLLNLEDDEIELIADSQVILAHAALLTPEETASWLAHFKDYKVKPLFAQLNHLLPNIEALKDGAIIEDRLGWVTDTFTLRGVLNKLGYQRGSIEDAGSFDHYSKSFDSLGLHVLIYFSGSYVPEENLPAVVYDLRFQNNTSSWRATALPITEVPPILLAEAYADYLTLADACSGFDPEWKKKTPW